MDNRPADPVQPSAWDAVRALVREQIAEGVFETWFGPTRALPTLGTTLRVGVPNEMFAEWLRSQYLALIRSTMNRAGLGHLQLEFVPPVASVPGAAAGRTDGAGLAPPVASAAARPGGAEAPRLNPRYSFDGFVVSSCNQFAHAASLAVCDQPGRAYNPLFLYGGVGLGKTHLMQALGNRLLVERPEVKLRYLTSEQFMNELIAAIRFEETSRFRDRYRQLDVLLVDDIQFLAGKESTQEEFFHTFNALHDAGRQIVLASDCPPRSIPGLEERLRSRFEWGLLADIQPPDLETKVAIVNKMAAARGWNVPSDVALFIASSIHSNVRELEGALTTLMASSSIRRQPPDLSLAREVIRTLIPTQREEVTLETVMRVVARHFNLKVPELKSRTNAAKISYPRQIAMYLGKKLAGESLPSIGLAFGGKHHTTVLHAVRKIELLRSTDPGTERTLHAIEEQLR